MVSDVCCTSLSLSALRLLCKTCCQITVLQSLFEFCVLVLIGTLKFINTHILCQDFSMDFIRSTQKKSLQLLIIYTFVRCSGITYEKSVFEHLKCFISSQQMFTVIGLSGFESHICSSNCSTDDHLTNLDSLVMPFLIAIRSSYLLKLEESRHDRE